MAEPNTLLEPNSTQELLKKVEDLGVEMPKFLPRALEKVQRYLGEYPIRHLPIELCCAHMTHSFEESKKEGKPLAEAVQDAKLDYRHGIPPLSGANNIRDFIACVTYGMLFKLIPSDEGTRLLYAAQVAHMALTKRPKKRGKSSHTRTGASDAKRAESTS